MAAVGCKCENATQKAELFVPDAAEAAAVLQEALAQNFKAAEASVVDCPDLTKAPFHCAAPGLCGSPRLADVGGVPNLIPLVTRSKLYDLKEVAKEVGLPGAFFIGAGAGSSRLAGVNCELVPNSDLASGNIQTRFAKVDEKGDCVATHYASNEFGLLANLLACEGKPGKVIHVKASTRTGKKDFVSAMRDGLTAKYGDKAVGVGGVFHIAKGTSKIHVMPDFSKTPLESDAAVEQWLKFYEFENMTCMSVFVSHDPGLDLRVSHTHGFNDRGQGGHYHYDTAPDMVEYEGYFVLAEHIFRVDPPKATHQIGRD